MSGEMRETVNKPCESPLSGLERKTPSEKLEGRSPEPRVRYSFEEELTFSPRLNSLSMKIVSEANRTSITERKQEKKCNSPVSFAFKPSLSTNSNKIVAKMKTCFWERQNKVVQKRMQMVEQGPSTIHPNFRRPASKETPEDGKEENGNLKSFSDQTCSIKETPRKRTGSKSKSPYHKSVDLLLLLKKGDMLASGDKRKCTCNERNSKGRMRINRTNSERTSKEDISGTKSTNSNNLHKLGRSVVKICKYCSEKLPDANLEAKAQLTNTTVEKENIMNNCSKIRNELKRSSEFLQKQKKQLTKRESLENVLNKHNSRKREIAEKVEARVNRTLEKNTKREGFGRNCDRDTKCDKKPGRVSSLPLSSEKTNEMDAVHQNLVKMKKIAGQAIKKKKVFICNGPYSSLRSALRRRGWIEKHFKASGHPLFRQESLSQESDEEEESEGFDETMKEKMNLVEGEDSSFLCDNQYGIMSRIVRKSMPILLWTLRRDDIDHRYLHKEQIVNHFFACSSFTSKAGLCQILRNLRYFDEVNASFFFPRCYRLCCSEEKEEFVEDYQLTALHSILKIVVEKHKEWEIYLQGLNEEDRVPDENRIGNSKEKPGKKVVLGTDVFRLAFKMSYAYFQSKQHTDIEETFSSLDENTKKANWTRILGYFTKLTRQNGVIAGSSEYVEECKRILAKMEEFHPQMKIDGYLNIWILKPGAKSRGRGIVIMNVLNEILNLSSDSVSKKENKWVIQKYIEKPYLVYRTKFDIRQWFLVTDWNPLVLWFYKDCYIRFCGQEFQLDKFDPQVHLSNNCVQRNYKIGERSEHLPDFNMWSNEEFKMYLKSKDLENFWDEVIYPGMKKAITAVLISSQDSLDYRRNCFELYGADFMIGEDMQPWLIEINSSPALGATTPVTERLCRNVLEDTLKVVLDRRERKDCDTGRFELAFKRPYISLPSYVGCTISIDGLPLRPLTFTKRKPNPIRISVKTPVTPRVAVSENDTNTKAVMTMTTVSGPSLENNNSLKMTPSKESVAKSSSEKSTTVTNQLLPSTNPPNPTTQLPAVKFCKNCKKKTKSPHNNNKNNNNNNNDNEADAILSSKIRPLIMPNVKQLKTNYKITKSRSSYDSEMLRALMDTQSCPLSLSIDEVKVNKTEDDGTFKEEEGSQTERCKIKTLELFEPFKMNYRVDDSHRSSLSRQVSLMTSEDVLKLKKRRWNAIGT